MNAIKGTFANRKYSFKGNGNMPIVKISCQSLSFKGQIGGMKHIMLVLSDFWLEVFKAYNALIIDSLDKTCSFVFGDITCNIMQYLVIMPDNSVPGNNRKFFNKISHARLVFYGIP